MPSTTAPAHAHSVTHPTQHPQGDGVAATGRRILALCVDWALAMAVSAGFFAGKSWFTLAVFAVMQIVLVGTLGYSIGHRVVGLQVIRLHGGWAGPVRALVRTLLVCLVVPAVITNRHKRGLHDIAAGTTLVRLKKKARSSA